MVLSWARNAQRNESQKAHFCRFLRFLPIQPPPPSPQPSNAPGRSNLWWFIGYGSMQLNIRTLLQSPWFVDNMACSENQHVYSSSRLARRDQRTGYPRVYQLEKAGYPESGRLLSQISGS